MVAFNFDFYEKVFSSSLDSNFTSYSPKTHFLTRVRWAEISLGARWMLRHIAWLRCTHRWRAFRLIMLTRRASIDIRMENFRYIGYVSLRSQQDWRKKKKKKENEFLAREFTLQTFLNLLPDHFFTLFPLQRTFQREKFPARVERTNLAWLLLSIKSKSWKRKVFIARR